MVLGERPRILVADNYQPFLRKLISLVSVDFDVVATATDGKLALELILRHKPDVAVLDVAMPGLSGIHVLKELGKYPGSPSVVICSVHTEQEIVQAALDEGALAYVFKQRIEPDLILALKSVVQGNHFMSSAMTYASGEVPMVGDRIKNDKGRMATVKEVGLGRSISIRWDEGVVLIEYPSTNLFTLVARRDRLR